MKINILAFGIAREIFGSPTIDLNVDNNTSVLTLKSLLENQYPRLKKLATYMVAVNSEYAQDHDTITERDEIAIIPPVSGG